LSGWLPSYYRELGLSLEAASLPLALFNASSLPAGLLATYFSDRQHRRRPYLAAGGALVIAGTVGLVLAPLQPAWLWVSLAGAGLGMVFALALALPTDLLDAQRAGSTVSLVLTVGYGGGLLAPLLAGALRDALGSFTLALVPTTAVGLAILLATAMLPETARGLGGAAGR
jgi:MFS transporter, CP family, cyanate transporter